MTVSYKDEDGRSVIETNKVEIAEKILHLYGKPFNFRQYPQMRQVLQIGHQGIVYKTGRQVAKTTNLALFQVTNAIGRPYHRSLYTAPSVPQVRRYSIERVGELMRRSPNIKRFYMDNSCRNNVTERSLLNGSFMHFYAMSQLESIRGLTAYLILQDELQDVVTDDISVVEEVASAAPDGVKQVVYAGTSKTEGGPLEMKWRASTQCEWVVICECGHRNLPTMENIGNYGFKCRKCRAEPLDVTKGYWVAMAGNLDMDYLGFSIPQIILPMHAHSPQKWSEILRKRSEYSLMRFQNEIMGWAMGSGITILTEDHLKACCAHPALGEYDFWEDPYAIPHDKLGTEVLIGTIDWGATSRKSYTVLSIWSVDRNKHFTLVYAKRFFDPDPKNQVEDIAYYLRIYGVQFVGADWGSGFAQNKWLMSSFNIKLYQFMYVAEQRELAVWDPGIKTFKINRTQSMTESFMKMRDQIYHFPRWSQFHDFAKDILCIYEEPISDRNSNDKVKYDHPEDTPDDFCHTAVYANILFYTLTQMPNVF